MRSAASGTLVGAGLDQHDRGDHARIPPRGTTSRDGRREPSPARRPRRATGLAHVAAPSTPAARRAARASESTISVSSGSAAGIGGGAGSTTSPVSRSASTYGIGSAPGGLTVVPARRPCRTRTSSQPAAGGPAGGDQLAASPPAARSAASARRRGRTRAAGRGGRRPPRSAAASASACARCGASRRRRRSASAVIAPPDVGDDRGVALDVDAADAGRVAAADLGQQAGAGAGARPAGQPRRAAADAEGLVQRAGRQLGLAGGAERAEVAGAVLAAPRARPTAAGTARR